MSSPPAPDLTGIHTKRDRAEEHINALRDEIKSFVEGTSYAQFESRLNPIDESYSVIFHESEPLPAQRWGLIVGDAC